MKSAIPRVWIFAAAFAALAAGIAPAAVAESDSAEVVARRLAFAEEAGSRVEAKPSVRGDDRDWFFLVKELRHLAAGRFWEKPRDTEPASGEGPVPGILEFRELLEARGVRLLLVPVPAKAAIYPEKLAAGFRRGDAEPLAPFLNRLREGGVEVLDLESVFHETVTTTPDTLLYCRQDAHFSPLAAKKVAERIAERLALSGTGASDAILGGEREDLTISGDQVVGSEWDGSIPGETLPVQKVTTAAGGPVEPDSGSSVLLLGDSHTLVFQAGEENGMHCRGAGVFDHLAFCLGFAPDLVGVRGSGLVQARKQLFYRASAAPGYWENKKAVIWLFSAREFTQSTDRPGPIPLDRT
jgi:alginate O-acetyltransferase complex protein AlgJ